MEGIDFGLRDRVAVQRISVSLSNTPNYKTKLNLPNLQVNMLCGYNTRNKMRWILLTDSIGQPILTQTFMKIGKKCELNFNSNQYNLDFYVSLRAKDKYKKFREDYDYINWGADFELCFVGYSQSTTDSLNNNLRKVLVGN